MPSRQFRDLESVLRLMLAPPSCSRGGLLRNEYCVSMAFSQKFGSRGLSLKSLADKLRPG